MTASPASVLVVSVGGSIADVPIVLGGTLDGDGLKQLSGTVVIDRDLGTLLQGLGPGLADAAAVLEQLIGGQSGIRLDRLEFGWRPDPAQAELALTLGAGRGGECRLRLLKELADGGGLAAGFEWRSSEPLAPNPLRDLVGEITFQRLGVLYCSRDGLAEVAGGRPLRGLSLSHEILVGGVDLLDRLVADGPAAAAPSPRSRDAADNPTAAPPAPRAAGPAAEPQADAAEPAHAIGAGLARSFELDKRIGPLRLRRLALRYDGGAADEPESRPRIAIALDAGLHLSVLELSLDGLGVSCPLDFKGHGIWDRLQFHLDGLGLAFASGPVEIGGSLLRRPGADLSFEGTLRVRTAAVTFSALGAYARVDGTHSFHAYAVVLRSFGGDPAFFVTGLAFGFGVNRRLKLPPIEGVATFPLVAAATGEPAFAELAELSKALRPSVTPAPGSYWLAAGVRFKSFGIVESFALVSVSFGTDLTIGLLGLSTLRVPPPAAGSRGGEARTLCHAELALRAEFNPAAGILAVEARLTSGSYLFDKACRLTGGFALRVWLKGEHAGDFVVTLGGYHPRFAVPAHYPAVPRLGVDWVVSRELRVTGQFYFALTPSCLMAGGRLAAVYDGGWIKAWFNAEADFLVAWKPFHYEIAIGVHFGVRATLTVDAWLFKLSLTLAFELGAELQLWGPPFAGSARIRFWVVSFRVSFGDARQRRPDPLDWDEFAASFLPAPQAICGIAFTGGLLREPRSGSGEPGLTVVDPHRLAFEVRSQVPCTAIVCDGLRVEGSDTAAAALGIAPMDATGLVAELRVALVREDGSGRSPDAPLVGRVLRTGFPRALWGRGMPALTQPDSELLAGVPNGVALRLDEQAVQSQVRHSLPAMPLEVFAWESIDKSLRWGPAGAAPPLEAPGGASLSDSLCPTGRAAARRAAVLAALRRVTPHPLNEVCLARTAAQAEDVFQAEPTPAALGQAWH